MRKDGRPLVTEFPIDPMDYIPILPPGEEVAMREGVTLCRRRTPRARDTSWMDDGIDLDDAEMWIP